MPESFGSVPAATSTRPPLPRGALLPRGAAPQPCCCFLLLAPAPSSSPGSGEAQIFVVSLLFGPSAPSASPGRTQGWGGEGRAGRRGGEDGAG